MHVVPMGDRDPVGGTLLWIGDPSLPEFQPAYRYCVQRAPQIAPRASCEEAAARPAAGVGLVVVARSTRQPFSPAAVESLSLRYPNAGWIDLLGPLCEGIRQSSVTKATRLSWHRWHPLLPESLDHVCRDRASGRDADCERPQSFMLNRSVAVIASGFVTAEGYLDLAEAAGATAVWCSTPDAIRVRNVDTVWWDDSIATPTNSRTWRQRVERFAGADRVVRHAWITHPGERAQREAALAAGIETVVSKPFRIESLLQTLQATPAEQPTFESCEPRQAAPFTTQPTPSRLAC